MGMSCDVGEVTESLENEQSSFCKLSVTSPTSHLIPKPFPRFTYVTTHSPTLPLLHLRYSSFSNPSFVSPMSQDFHLYHLASRQCTALEENGCTDIIACQLRDSWSYQISEIVKRRYFKTAFRTFFISSGVIRVSPPLRSSSCTLVRPSVNCPHHRLTILSLIMSDPNTWHNWW